MLIEHFHNATCIVTGRDGTRVLCDPWFHDGVFEGSWGLAHAVPRIPRRGDDFDLLYISHAHPDHCDERYLATLDRDVPIVVPKEVVFPILVPKLTSLGFEDVIALDDRDTATFGTLALTVFEPFQANRFDAAAELPNFLDSAVLIRDGRHSFLNTNDNLPTVAALAAIEDEFGIPDITTLLYNSAGYYPQCVRDLDHDEKLDQRQVVLDKAFATCLELARASRSPRVMPFAGDYALTGSLAALNPYLPVSTPHVAATMLEANGRSAVALGAGGIFSLEEDRVVRTGDVYTEASAFARAEAVGGRYPYELQPAVDAGQLRDDLDRAAGRLNAKQGRLGVFPDYDVEFVGRDGASIGVVDVSTGTRRHRLTCHLDARLFADILGRRSHWDNAQIGCHIAFNRSNHPDYSSDLHFILSLLHL